MGECALSRSQLVVSGCILPKTRLFSQREGLFYRRDREREREKEKGKKVGNAARSEREKCRSPSLCGVRRLSPPSRTLIVSRVMAIGGCVRFSRVPRRRGTRTLPTRWPGGMRTTTRIGTRDFAIRWYISIIVIRFRLLSKRSPFRFALLAFVSKPNFPTVIQIVK